MGELFDTVEIAFERVETLLESIRDHRKRRPNPNSYEWTVWDVQQTHLFVELESNAADFEQVFRELTGALVSRN